MHERDHEQFNLIPVNPSIYFVLNISKCLEKTIRLSAQLVKNHLIYVCSYFLFNKMDKMIEHILIIHICNIKIAPMSLDLKHIS